MSRPAAALNYPGFRQPGRVLANRARPAVQHTRIKQDSIILKICACVPFFGAVAQYVVEKQINKKIEQISPLNHRLLAKLIQVKNDFKKCGVVRNCIHVCMSVTSVALLILAVGIIPAIQPALFSSFIVTWLIYSVKVAIDDIKKNKKSIQLLKGGMVSPYKIVVR